MGVPADLVVLFIDMNMQSPPTIPSPVGGELPACDNIASDKASDNQTLL